MVAVVCVAVAAAGTMVADACTAFCAVGQNGQVLVGNNEDWTNPRTKLWFVAAKQGSYGRMYVGFDDMWPQGGMNERGLWFDGFAVPPAKLKDAPDLPSFSGEIVDHAMATCSTVDEVVRLFSQYNRNFLREGILMFADASGDAVSIEPDAMVRKANRHFVQTNFYQSRPRTGADDKRFATASTMLETAGANISVDLFRRILSATQQRTTLYSNVHDLKSRTMHLYYFHDFERAVTFNLADELKKGERVLDIPALFPRNTAAETFAARRQVVNTSTPVAFLAAMVVVPIVIIAIAVFAWARGGQRARVGVSTLIGIGVVLVASGVWMFRGNRQASEKWVAFSIGPASGNSLSLQRSSMRSDGITLKGALSIAYDIPAVRVIGPPWLSQVRYSITAAVSPEASDLFRPLLQQELNTRMRLETHVDVRPVDIFVLTAVDPARLGPASNNNASTWMQQSSAELQAASMERLTEALQSILSRPVIDETRISSSYDLDLTWTEDRVTSLTSALDRYGLRLTPAKRDMQVLIVDGIRRDPSLVLLEHVGHITRSAPPSVREHISRALRIY
jgi:uncharacterized protein (TIGR03435 family)